MKKNLALSLGAALLSIILFSGFSRQSLRVHDNNLICGTDWTVHNNTSVTITEVQVYNNNENQLVCSWTNISGFSTSTTQEGGGSSTHLVCIKVSSIPVGGGYCKIWNGTTLVVCLRITAANVTFCIDDVPTGCGVFDIEFTTSHC